MVPEFDRRRPEDKRKKGPASAPGKIPRRWRHKRWGKRRTAPPGRHKPDLIAVPEGGDQVHQHPLFLDIPGQEREKNADSQIESVQQ